jgi:hypothetical protein
MRECPHTGVAPVAGDRMFDPDQPKSEPDLKGYKYGSVYHSPRKDIEVNVTYPIE